jgi:phosphoglycerate dehydrogenase-like enzyme
MTFKDTQKPIRILVSQAALIDLKSRLEGHADLSYELFSSNNVVPGAEFDVALISRDVTSTSTKQNIKPSTQAFYDLLLGSKDLRWVQLHSAGADRHIYLDLMKRGVVISGSSGVNAQIVTQNAIAGVLMLAREFPKMLKAQSEKRWDSLINHPLPPDLAGQTVVILGRGPIGNGIAKILDLLGLHVIRVGFTQRADHVAEAGIDDRYFSELRDILPKANWLILACPLSQETYHLLNKETIALLPNAAHLINIARGEIIYEPDLIDALSSKKLAGAYLDVFASEPLDPDSLLWSMDKVIVTPHSAGHSAGNESRVLDLFVENLLRYAQGEVLKNTIKTP